MASTQLSHRRAISRHATANQHGSVKSYIWYRDTLNRVTSDSYRQAHSRRVWCSVCFWLCQETIDGELEGDSLTESPFGWVMDIRLLLWPRCGFLLSSDFELLSTTFDHLVPAQRNLRTHRPILLLQRSPLGSCRYPPSSI